MKDITTRTGIMGAYDNALLTEEELKDKLPVEENPAASIHEEQEHYQWLNEARTQRFIAGLESLERQYYVTLLEAAMNSNIPDAEIRRLVIELRTLKNINSYATTRILP